MFSAFGPVGPAEKSFLKLLSSLFHFISLFLSSFQCQMLLFLDLYDIRLVPEGLKQTGFGYFWHYVKSNETKGHLAFFSKKKKKWLACVLYANDSCMLLDYFVCLSYLLMQTS